MAAAHSGILSVTGLTDSWDCYLGQGKNSLVPRIFSFFSLVAVTVIWAFPPHIALAI